MLRANRILRLVLIPVLLGFAVVLLLYLVLGKQQPSVAATGQQVPMVQVVAAKGAIAARTILSEGQLQYKQVPQAVVTPYAVTDMKQVVGQVNTETLLDGEMLLAPKLGGKDKGLAYQIPPGRRAVTVRVDGVTGVAGYPEVGDSIDMIMLLTPAAKDGKDAKKVAHLLFENVRILAKGDNSPTAFAQAPSKAPAGTDATKQNEGKATQTYIVALPVEEAAQLVVAQESAKIYFALRPASDPSVRPDYVFSEEGLAAPPATINLQTVAPPATKNP